MSTQSYVGEKSKLMEKKIKFQRWFYAIIGIVITMIIILLTFGQIRDIKKDNQEFAFCLFLILHSVYVLISILSTAVLCRLTNAVLTTLTIILLSTYTGVHFYIRFTLFRHYPQEDSYLITIRLGFVLILLILLLPWTNLIVHEYRMNIASKNDIIYPRSTTFSWFLYLDFILIISLLILNIRSEMDLRFYQIIFLSIGISFSSLWLYLGRLIAENKADHWFISTMFYLLSLGQIIHLVYIINKAISEYHHLTKLNELNLFPLLIIIFICSSTNILVHILTMIMSFILMDI